MYPFLNGSNLNDYPFLLIYPIFKISPTILRFTCVSLINATCLSTQAGVVSGKPFLFVNFGVADQVYF